MKVSADFSVNQKQGKIYAKEVSYIQNFQNVAVILHVNLETIIIFQNIYIYSTLYKELKFREQE